MKIPGNRLKPGGAPEASFPCERQRGEAGRLWRSAGHVTAEEEFVEFAGAVSPRLQGMAFLLVRRLAHR